MWWLYLILFIFGYLIYRGLSSSDQTSEVDTRYPRRRTGRGTNYSEEREKESLVQSAKRQEQLSNYDEASRLYLRAGQVFSAAKMKALKGPQHANQAVELIQINSPQREELITRNLANEFFYRLEQPATSAALLRALGLHDEAEAVEVAAGISVSQTVSQSSSPQSAAPSPTSQSMEIEEEPAPDEIADPVEPEIAEKEKVESPKDSYPNSMMMASTTQENPCSVCKRKIKSGDSFIYCLNCGRPGHYGHLGEMIKVTGKCPVCKERLAPTMYDI